MMRSSPPLAAVASFAITMGAIGSGHSQPSPENEPVSRRELNCLIEPYVTTKLSASVPGLISRVLVNRGDVVRKGQVLAELESQVEQANVALARVRAINDIQIKSNRT